MFIKLSFFSKLKWLYKIFLLFHVYLSIFEVPNEILNLIGDNYDVTNIHV